MRLRLTRKELCDRLGVTVNAVGRWQRDGMPVGKQKGRLYYEVAKIADWFSRNKRLSRYVYKLGDLLESQAGVKPAAAETPKEPGDLRAMLERARQAEIDAWQEYCNAMPIMRQNCMEHHRAAAEQRRKLEKDIAQIELSQREVVPKEDAERALANVAIAVKNDLLSIPTSLAPRLEGCKAAEISVMLRDAIIDALRHLAR